ncbi:MAG: NADH-quinone oxidoreductase subunit J [Gammaproteobacteria bacterium]|nr:NADH-quinone oxidoreductase subunit J [Gammaproteobacteria bacterium]
MPFSVEALIFWPTAALLVFAALAVITVRNPVHAALFLVLCFFSSAVLWLMLEAEFLGIALVLVYVGAVMVLFLFVVMMLDINIAVLRQGFVRYAPLAAIFAIVMVAELAYVIWHKQLGIAEYVRTPLPEGYSNTSAIGQVMYTEYVYPFEIAALILLVGIVVAITLTMRKREGTRHQNAAEQVKVKRDDRVRLVKVESETDQ